MLKKTLLISTIILVGIILILPITIKAESKKNLVNIYFFHSETCSHCKEESKILDIIEQKYKQVKIYRYEIHKNNNYEIFNQAKEIYNIKTNGVPLTIIGETPYIGYNKKISNLQFAKTIEYYSRYGYTDKIGEYLQIKELPNYEITSDREDIEDFINTYGNYRLIGNLYTDNFDLTANAILLGALSQLNIIKIISTIIIIALLTKIKKQKNKVLLLMTYFILLETTIIFSIINNQILNTLLKIFILSISGICVFKLIKKKNSQQQYKNLLLLIISFINYIELIFNNNLINLKELINLNNIIGIDKIMYYIHYLFIVGIINICLILSFNTIKNIILKYKYR